MSTTTHQKYYVPHDSAWPIVGALALLLIAGLWILYRVVRGWWNLMQRQTMPMA